MPSLSVEQDSAGVEQDPGASDAAKDEDAAKDATDTSAKVSVEGPVDERADAKPAEQQTRVPTESEPPKQTEAPAGEKSARAEKPAAAEKSAASDTSKPAQTEIPPAVKPKPKRELTPAMLALRDKIRATLGTYQKMPFNTRQNTPDEIISYCHALGCDTEIYLIGNEGERRANAIMCLCWNASFGGYQPLTIIDGHISARLGYGLQSRPSQLLAALALARVPASYPMHVGKVERSVADLAESEKLSCRSGSDLSLKLVGLAYYVDGAEWKNDRGEPWSLEKIIQEELAQPTLAPGIPGVDCLLGLSYAVIRREKRNLPIEGQFARAQKYLGDFQNYAFGIQNSDGTWGYYLSGRGVNRDDAVGLRSSGSVLEWLAISLPDERLDDRGMLTGMVYLVNSLNSQRYLNDLPELSTREIASTMRALHALAIYDERVFNPADAEQPPEEKKSAETAAQPASGYGQTR
jgi:hypothetical protein